MDGNWLSQSLVSGLCLIRGQVLLEGPCQIMQVRLGEKHGSIGVGNHDPIKDATGRYRPEAAPSVLTQRWSPSLASSA